MTGAYPPLQSVNLMISAILVAILVPRFVKYRFVRPREKFIQF